MIKEFEVQFKWLATWFILLLLRRSWRLHDDKLDPKRVRSVLFLRYDRIGDMVVSLPTFHVLKQRYPHIRIDVLASMANKMIIESDNSIHEIVVYRKSNLIQTWRTMRRLQRRHYDVAIDLVANVSATSLIMLLMAGRGSYKIGVHKNNSINFYDFIIPTTKMRTTPAVKLHFASLTPFGIHSQECDNDGGLQLSPQQWQRGTELVAKLRDRRYSGLIGINISAGKPNRDWGVDRYRQAVIQLSVRYPRFQFVIFAAPQEYQQAQTIAAGGGNNVSVIPPKLSLLEVSAMIKQLDCMITPDTSICHITASMKIPLLALYTAAEVNFQRWRPYTRQCWILRPRSGDSLAGISVEDYLQKTEEVLSVIYSQAPTR